MPFGLRDLPHGLFGDNFAVGAADIGQANIRPDNLGLRVANVTGSSIPAGSLVYLNGWDTSVLATGMPSIALASASGWSTRAQWVTLAAIANNALGTVGQHFALTGQNTNAATVGDPVYLNTTAGAYAMTAFPGSAVIFQVVGRVAVKSATVGVIEFNLLSGAPAVLIAPIQSPMVPATIPTTGAPAAQARFIAPYAGTLGNVRVGGSAGLATSDSNFIQFGLINKGTGAGTTQMLNQAAGASSTKATGGGALIADGSTGMVPSVTPSDLVIARNDLLLFQAVVTGTLANTVPEAVARLTIIPS